MIPRTALQWVMNWGKLNNSKAPSHPTVTPTVHNYDSGTYLDLKSIRILSLSWYFYFSPRTYWEVKDEKCAEGCKKTNIYKQLFVSLFACKWVSMEQKLSHYRSHKYETNLHRGRQHDGVHFFLFILILRYVLLILFLLFQVCNVQLLLKMWDPVDCAVVNKLTIKYSTSSVGRSQWKIDTKASTSTCWGR